MPGALPARFWAASGEEAWESSQILLQPSSIHLLSKSLSRSARELGGLEAAVVWALKGTDKELIVKSPHSDDKSPTRSLRHPWPLSSLLWTPDMFRVTGLCFSMPESLRRGFSASFGLQGSLSSHSGLFILLPATGSLHRLLSGLKCLPVTSPRGWSSLLIYFV